MPGVEIGRSAVVGAGAERIPLVFAVGSQWYGKAWDCRSPMHSFPESIRRGILPDIGVRLFPGADGSSVGQFPQSSNATVGRYRYDFGGSSSVGGTLTSRAGDGYFNRVASAESRIRFTDADQITLGEGGHGEGGPGGRGLSGRARRYDDGEHRRARRALQLQWLASILFRYRV